MKSRIEELQLSRVCVSLQAEDKVRRKQALHELWKTLFDNDDQWEVKEYIEIWKNIHKNMVQLLSDQAEACRVLAVEILKKFFAILPVSDENIVYVIPVIARRLGSQEIVEPSEEVRLDSIVLLRIITSRYKDHLSAYMDDMIATLSRSVTDNYPNVKKESCECISELAKSISRSFYARSESLIKPVLSNFTHQHYRVRVASVKTIGDVVQFGTNKSIEEVATPMAERLFDQSAAVRMAVVEVAGRWFLELRDRYSWWHKLIPLLLTGLHDEIEEIRNKAGKMWTAAGSLYMEENESDEKFKDQMDFLIDEPEHYPPNIVRPNLGCRTIAQQNLCKLVGGIAAELGDWMADIRVRAAQLLCVLVLNVEQAVTQHIEKLLPPMYRACNDEDKRVVVNVELAAKYMGYFVPPDIYCQLVLPTLEENPTAGHLAVFAAILSGSQRKCLAPKLQTIGSFLQQEHICRSRKVAYQKEVLHCCESLITVCKQDCQTISQELFTAMFTVLSMAVEEEIERQSLNLLAALTETESLNDTQELYEFHLRPLLLLAYHSVPKAWTIYSAEFHILRSCLTRTGPVASRHLDLILPMLKETMNNDADAEMRLKQFLLLSAFLLRKDETLKFAENLSEFVNTILDEIIEPSLVWAAGRTAEAVRTAAVCCLCAALEESPSSTEKFGGTAMGNISRSTENICDKASREYQVELFPNTDRFLALFGRVVPILLTLIDDNARKTRLYSLRAVCQIMAIGRTLSCVTEEHVHQVYPVVLKRLDDGCDDIRQAALRSLTVVWGAAPRDYDLVFSRSHVDALYTSAIVHLDDPDEGFQEMMLGAMMQLAKVHPELLAQKIQNCKSNFRNLAGLEKLLEHTHALLSQKP